jgi:Ca-activated chloride channel family protein
MRLRLASFAAVSIGFVSLSGLPARAQFRDWRTDTSWQTQLIGRSETAGSLRLPLVDEQIHVDIDAQHATTRLRQTYQNESGGRIEGLYTLRAGLGVRAEGFAYWNGEQKIVGEVFERAVARQVYENVVRRRRDPGLLEQTGDGVFSFAVSPIEPGERKRVEVTYSQWLPRQGTAVEYRAPVTRGDADVSITIADQRELTGISSPTHAIDVQRLGTGQYMVRARKVLAGEGLLVLRFQVVERPWTMAGYVHRDKGQDAYFVLTMAAPEHAREATTPKDVTLVIDRSGSMAGEALQQARDACIDIIKRLRPDDRLNVVLFDHRVEKLYSEPQPLTVPVRRQALDYVELMDDGGGTDLALALEMALEAQTAGDRPRVILFFTDGRSAVEPVLEAARGDKHDVRVFTVGFGPDVNRPLLARLAASKRGRFTYIASADSIEREVSALYRQIDAPVLVDVKLAVTGGAAARVYPPSLPDLFVDDEIRIIGRLRADGPVLLTISGKERGRPVVHQARLDMPGEVRRPWVGRLWAEARVDDLVDEIALGGERPELRDEVTDLALAYNFTTPYTSFLAIPASELDWQSANQLGTARMHKADILRRKPEAARLGGIAPGDAPAAEHLINGASTRQRLQKFASNEADENPLSEREAASPRPYLGHVDRNKVALDEESSSSRKGRGGCASCELGGSGRAGPGILLLVAACVLLARRSPRRVTRGR